MRAGSRLTARNGQAVISNLEGAETTQFLSVRSSGEPGSERTLCGSPRDSRGDPRNFLVTGNEVGGVGEEGIGGENSRRGIGGPELSLEPPRGLLGKELFTWSSEGEQGPGTQGTQGSVV